MRDMRWVDTERCASRAPCPGVCFTSSLRCYRPIMRGDSFVLKIRTVSLLLTPLVLCSPVGGARGSTGPRSDKPDAAQQERSEEHTSELQSRLHLVCRLLLE